MASGDTAKLIASLEMVLANWDPNIKKALGDTKKLDSAFSEMGRNIGKHVGQGMDAARKNIERGAVLLAGAAAAGIGASIKLASDLNETQSKVGVVFKQNAAEVLAFGKSSAAGLGMSENAAEAAAATYGNLFVSMGFTADKSADMSIALVKLAGDLASFNNIDPSEALEKLRAGLTGESEPLKTLGVNINETIIKQEAMRLGLVKGNATLTAAQKAQAAYSLIFKQTATAQGDFARTSTGLANQQRILRANLENVGATIGTKLLPKVAELAQKLNQLIVANGPAIQAFADKLPGAFDAAAAFVEKIPWGQVAKGLEMAAGFAGQLVGVFTSMPPEVQATLLALAGLNKLTGGMVTNIGGDLFKGLGGALKGSLFSRGSTPANPVFTKDIGGVGGPGGIPLGPAFLSTPLGLGLLGLAGAAAGVVVGQWINSNATPATPPPPGGTTAGGAGGGRGGAAQYSLAAAAALGGRDMDKDLGRYVSPEGHAGRDDAALVRIAAQGMSSILVKELAKHRPSSAEAKGAESSIMAAFKASTSPSLVSMNRNLETIKAQAKAAQDRGDMKLAAKLNGDIKWLEATLGSRLGIPLDTIAKKNWTINAFGVVMGGDKGEKDGPGGTGTGTPTTPPKPPVPKGSPNPSPIVGFNLSVTASVTASDVTGSQIKRNKIGNTGLNRGLVPA